MTLEVDVSARRGDFEVSAAFDAEPGETLLSWGRTVRASPHSCNRSPGCSLRIGGPSRSTVQCWTETERGLRRRSDRSGSCSRTCSCSPTCPRSRTSRSLCAPGKWVVRRLEIVRRLSWTDWGSGRGSAARPADLSGGEAQRVALARALVTEPALLLLDEPLSALDVGARVRVRDLIREELARFPGVRVIVTHDPVEASTLADRLVLLEAGRVTQIGTPMEIRNAAEVSLCRRARRRQRVPRAIGSSRRRSRAVGDPRGRCDRGLAVWFRRRGCRRHP